MSDTGSAGAPAKRVGYVDGVNVAISICLTYTLCVTAIRAWIRRRLYGWDDIVVGAATLFIIGFYAASYVGLSNGLGHKLAQLEAQPTSEMATLNRSTVARIILFIITLYLSKACVVAFLARTTKTRKHRLVHYIIFGLLSLLGLGSVIAVTVDCGDPDTLFFWDLEKTAPYCPSQPTRWQIVTALDVFSELVLAILPLHLMWGLQMATKKKLMIIAAFYMRLPVIAFSIVGNYWAISHYPYERDPGLAGALITIWQVVEVAYSLAAVTIAASKAFADAFTTGFGWGDTFREVGNSQYMMESAASRSRTAPSRGGTRASGLRGTNGSGSAAMTDPKTVSPLATNADVTQVDEAEKYELSNRYHQNDYNYGRPTTRGSDQPRSATGSWRKKDRVTTTTTNTSSSYVDPLEGENDDEPMKLRPERKLRNTAIIEHDPVAAAAAAGGQHRHDNAGSRESVNDDMYIVRNVDYSVRYDEAPILEEHKRAPSGKP